MSAEHDAMEDPLKCEIFFLWGAGNLCYSSLYCPSLRFYSLHDILISSMSNINVASGGIVK